MTCGSCSRDFTPRPDNKTAKYCSLRCHWDVGVRFKGDAPLSYSGQHRRVYKAYGAARQFACFTQCCRPAKQWACVGDPSNPEEYVPMCVSCHKRFDLARIRAAR